MSERPDNTARCILFSRRGFLLVQHSNCSEANRGKWGLPGGRLEDGEGARSTLERELEEELRIEVAHYVEVGRYPTGERWHRVFAARFDEDITSWDASEIESARWFALSEAEHLECSGALHLGFETQSIRDFLAAVGLGRDGLVGSSTVN